MSDESSSETKRDLVSRQGTLRHVLIVLGPAGIALMGVIFSPQLTVVAIVLIQTLYVQDVLGENVVVLGRHEPKPK